jgi:non-specific serine/threonine protein kinase
MPVEPARLTYNLPNQLTSFIGREHELGEIKRLLEENRLLTLSGAGGTGKTRLALHLATQVKDRYTEGVWLVELAALSDPLLVAPTLAQTLKLKEEPGQPLLTTLVDFLQPKETLLLLDNCEHLLEECARLSDRLLRSCPALRILATSRESLNISGELTFRVPSLALPEQNLVISRLSAQAIPGSSAQSAWQNASEYEAVRLFVARARAAQPGFDLSQQNASAVVQVCQRLDGIPLALELAAGRLRGMGIEQLADRLNDRFRLLTGGNRAALPRQQTLLALLDWSYRLLTEAEKVVFARLAIFAGSFSLSATEAVCAGEYTLASDRGQIESEQVLEILWQLVNKSLVVMEETPGDKDGLPDQTRYRLLETIREYGKAKLAEAGELEQTAWRHYQWHLHLAEEASPHLVGPAPAAWVQRLERAHDNLRAALDWAIWDNQAQAAARLALAVWKFWHISTHQPEGLRRLEQILALSGQFPLPAIMQPRLFNAMGVLAHTICEFERADRYNNRALALWREQDDKKGLTTALLDLGWQNFEAMKLEQARQYATESLALARATGERRAIAAAIYLFSLIQLAFIQSSNGTNEFDAAALAEVITDLEESLAIWRELKDSASIAGTLSMFARAEAIRGNYELAKPLVMEAVRLEAELGNYYGFIGSSLALLFIALNASNQAEGAKQAARMLGMWQGWAIMLGGAQSPWAVAKFPEVKAQVTALIGETAFDQEFAKGQEMTTFGASIALAEAITAPAIPQEPTQTRLATTSPGYPKDLSEREVEVLRLVAGGLFNPEIAAKLVLSRRTVEAHLRSIFNKLEVTSCTAARFAVEQGLCRLLS